MCHSSRLSLSKGRAEGLSEPDSSGGVGWEFSANAGEGCEEGSHMSIYIYMCVCVCDCARTHVYDAHTITYLSICIDIHNHR